MNTATATANLSNHNTKHMNIEAIRKEATQKPVAIKTDLLELITLFGMPASPHNSRPDWAVMLDTGECGHITLVDANRAEVRSDSRRLVESVQIAVELHQEQKRVGSTTGHDALDEAIESADTIYQSVASIHGNQYAHIVEVAVCTRKALDIIGSCLSTLAGSEAMPREVAERLHDAASSLMAKLLSSATKASDLNVNSEAEAKQIMDWAERILETEKAGVMAFIKSNKLAEG